MLLSLLFGQLSVRGFTMAVLASRSGTASGLILYFICNSGSYSGRRIGAAPRMKRAQGASTVAPAEQLAARPAVHHRSKQLPNPCFTAWLPPVSILEAGAQSAGDSRDLARGSRITKSDRYTDQLAPPRAFRVQRVHLMPPELGDSLVSAAAAVLLANWGPGRTPGTPGELRPPNQALRFGTLSAKK
jgi:hypothetical protein